jgi:hypothetical protein
MSWLFALPDKYLFGMLFWLAGGLLAFWGLLKYRRRLRRAGRKLTPANLLLSAWIFLALLTGVELYFALLFDATDSFNMSNVSEVWFRRHVEPEQHVLKLGSASITYRDDQPVPRPVPSNRKHICFVGDSFTFGHGVADVSDRFTNRIRTELDSRFPEEYLISNLSMPGTDLNWVDALVRELVREDIRIDTLVYVFCPNDIEVYHPDHMKNVERLGRLKPEGPLLEHTYFFNLLYYRIRMASEPALREYYGYLADYYTGEPWERMQNQFEEFAGFCNAQGIELKVVIFPFLQNLEGESPFDPARHLVREFCEQREIPVLDLHRTLSEHAGENLTVSLFDAHPNSRAHQLAAEALLAFLVK